MHEVFPLYCHYNRDDLLHVGGRRFFDGHGVACGAVVTHGTLAIHHLKAGTFPDLQKTGHLGNGGLIGGSVAAPRGSARS